MSITPEPELAPPVTPPLPYNTSPEVILQQASIAQWLGPDIAEPSPRQMRGFMYKAALLFQHMQLHQQVIFHHCTEVCPSSSLSEIMADCLLISCGASLMIKLIICWT